MSVVYSQKQPLPGHLILPVFHSILITAPHAVPGLESVFAGRMGFTIGFEDQQGTLTSGDSISLQCCKAGSDSGEAPEWLGASV